MSQQEEHISVLKDEILGQFAYLSTMKEGYFFDGTLGAGGHSLAIAQKASKNIKFVGTDLDQDALRLAQANIAKAGMVDRFVSKWDNFKDAKMILDELEVDHLVGALIDLGVSSMQFDRPERGFSFKYPDEILDMRMNQQQELDAKGIINTYAESDLIRIFRQFGEEKFASRIARGITRARKVKPVKTVGDLLSILSQSIPKKFQMGRIHYATKVFQALRIEVNAELAKLDEAIFNIVEKLTPGSKLAMITFHSLEDRIVKSSFIKLQNPCECPAQMPCICGKKPIVRILTKKPIIPTDEEISINPRSRSAKLRVIEKL